MKVTKLKEILDSFDNDYELDPNLTLYDISIIGCAATKQRIEEVAARRNFENSYPQH